MKLLSAEFVTSAHRLAPGEREGRAQGKGMVGVPRDGLPHIAFAGRSNVGKSSLLNALCRRSIARTSAAPGKTRLANVYRVTLEGGRSGAGRWSVYFVDLPGYGYARGGEAGRHELAEVAEAYLAEPASTEQSRHVRAVLLLIDSRHPGLASDLEAARWLAGLDQDPIVVATKIDKLSRAERTRNLRELERNFGKAALLVSADSGEGLDELWQKIANLARR